MDDAEAPPNPVVDGSSTAGDCLHIAVVGDVHGHLTLTFRILKRWEQETGLTLDLVLQVGDLGAFPPPFRLDKATLRFARDDPDELEFAAYYEGTQDADEVFGPDAPPHRRLSANLVFIKGNHEDSEFLADHEGSPHEPVPVDAYHRIRYLAGGARWTFARGRHALTIGALGGIADRGRPGATSASPYYTAGELRRLRAGGHLDVLLTHDPPRGAAARLHPRYEYGGSPDVLALLDELRPAYHFCGHYHEPGQALDAPEGTRSYILNAVNFLKAHRLNPGCIGILRWSGREPLGFDILAAPWLGDFTRANFRVL